MTALDEPREAKVPFHLRGSYAPITQEVEAFDLPAQGVLPDGLNGTYVRNGSNPQNADSPHWFFGDGMVHGVKLTKGKAEWYRNKWVQTQPFRDQQGFGEGAPGGEGKAGSATPERSTVDSGSCHAGSRTATALASSSLDCRRTTSSSTSIGRSTACTARSSPAWEAVQGSRAVRSR